jgi:hypothetical protein
MRVERFRLGTGLRGDFVKQYGFEWLPGVSVTHKANSALAIRLRGGLVYETSTVFNEKAEKIQFPEYFAHKSANCQQREVERWQFGFQVYIKQPNVPLYLFTGRWYCC